MKSTQDPRGPLQSSAEAAEDEKSDSAEGEVPDQSNEQARLSDAEDVIMSEAAIEPHELDYQSGKDERVMEAPASLATAVTTEVPSVTPAIAQEVAQGTTMTPETPIQHPASVDPSDSLEREVGGNTVDTAFKEAPSDHRSALIRRIKEHRRRSGLRQVDSPQAVTTASPWFASRRSDDISSVNKDQEQHDVGLFKIPKKDGPKSSNPTPKKQLRGSDTAKRSPDQEEYEGHSISSLKSSSSNPATGFRTALAYFVRLASLDTQFGNNVDVLAVVVAAKPITRAESGPKDYNLLVYLTEPPSSQKSQTYSPSLTLAQFFRPRKTAFPCVVPGDALLMRDFKVQSFGGSLSLLSTETSSWAVFRQDSDVQVRGPPIEYGPEERGFARGQRSWWEGLDAGTKQTLTDSTEKKTPSARKASSDTRTRKRASPKKSNKKGPGFEIPPLAKPAPRNAARRSRRPCPSRS